MHTTYFWGPFAIFIIIFMITFWCSKILSKQSELNELLHEMHETQEKISSQINFIIQSNLHIYSKADKASSKE